MFSIEAQMSCLPQVDTMHLTDVGMVLMSQCRKYLQSFGHLAKADTTKEEATINLNILIKETGSTTFLSWANQRLDP